MTQMNEDIIHKELVKYKFLYQAVRNQNSKLENVNEKLRDENKYLNGRIKNLINVRGWKYD